jgi:hypothetical protein
MLCLGRTATIAADENKVTGGECLDDDRGRALDVVTVVCDQR